MRRAAGITGRLLGFGSVLFSSLHGYRRSSMVGDLVAALTLLSIAVPGQLATARLAGMPPITGLYAFVAGTVLFALLGANPQLSVGADSTVAPLFAVGLAAMAATNSPHYVALVGILAAMVGVFVTLVGVLRFGWLAEFLSAPIISGFLAGVAVIITVDQLPDLLGVPGAGGNTLHRIGALIGELGTTNGWSLGIGIGVFAIVLIAQRIDRRLPGALAGLVASTILVGVLGLRSHGVAVLGSVAHGAPHLGLHGLSWSALSQVAPIAAVVALVIVSQTAATTRAAADQGGYEVDLNRDLIGVGAGNVVAGLVGAFPVNASPPGTAAVISASGRTQAAGLGAAAVIVALIPAAALLENLPLATLAAVLMVIAARILPLRDLVDIARYDRFEFGLALITTLTVALVGVEQGIAVAVALAILDRVRLTARPQLHVLGRVPSTTSWVPLGVPGRPSQLPGVLVALFATPLWYANAAHFRDEITAAIDREDRPLQVLVLDAIGMTDIDYTGSRALRELLEHLDHRHIVFAMARTSQTVRSSLARSGLLQRIGEENLFPTVGEAVTALHLDDLPS